MKDVRLLTRKQAAEYLSISLRTLDSMLKRKQLPFYKYGEQKKATIRFNQIDLMKWLERQRNEAQTA